VGEPKVKNYEDFSFFSTCLIGLSLLHGANSNHLTANYCPLGFHILVVFDQILALERHYFFSKSCVIVKFILSLGTLLCTLLEIRQGKEIR
jgi:hypothetical protein